MLPRGAHGRLRLRLPAGSASLACSSGRRPVAADRAGTIDLGARHGAVARPRDRHARLASRRGRAAAGDLAVGGETPDLDGERRRAGRLGARGRVLCDRHGEHLLLIDPLAVPATVDELRPGPRAGDRPHVPLARARRPTGRGAPGAPIFVPPPDEGDNDPTAGARVRRRRPPARRRGGVPRHRAERPRALDREPPCARPRRHAGRPRRRPRDPGHLAARRDARRGAGDAPAPARPARRVRPARPTGRPPTGRPWCARSPEP